MQIHEVLINRPTEGLTEASPLSYIKALSTAGAAPGTDYRTRVNQAETERLVNKMTPKTLSAWRGYINQVEKSITDPQELQKWQNRTDGKYEQYLASWIQNNLMKGLYLPSVQNYGQIAQLINQLSQANLNAGSQQSLWKNLIRVCAQSMQAVQMQQQQQQPQPQPNNPRALAQILTGLFGPNPDLAKIRAALIQVNNNSNQFSSTGSQTIDALLLALGLNVV